MAASDQLSRCKYEVHCCVQNCKKCLHIYLLKAKEMDKDRSEFFKKEIRQLELRKLPFSKKFSWKDSGQLNMVVSTRDLSKEKKVPKEKLEQMNFVEKMLVFLGDGNNATRHTVILEIFDADENKLLTAPLDVNFTEQPPEETKPAMENDLPH